MPDDRHEENVQHFQDVGRCLEIAFDEHDPERAMQFYSDCIAQGAPYEPITLVSASPNECVVDMGIHGRIAINPSGEVAVCQ
jgi:hypothetical protein